MDDPNGTTDKNLKHIQDEMRERSATEVPAAPAHEQAPPEADLSWQDVQTQWPRFYPKARAAWPELGEEELERVDGSYDRLVSALQARYGLENSDAKGQVQAWLVRLGTEQ